METDSKVKIINNHGVVLTCEDVSERLAEILRQAYFNYPGNAILMESFFRHDCMQEFLAISGIYGSFITNPIIVNVYFHGLSKAMIINYSQNS
jgi:hypothetical protein